MAGDTNTSTMAQIEPNWQTAASANLREARKRHGRLGRPKSRNGCLTCKRRRVKCDETQPECNRCQSSGRMCTGYAESFSNTTSPRSSTGSTSSPLASPKETQLSLSLGLRDDERRQFDFYVSRAAPRLAGSFDQDFWCGSVLQAAQHEPVILDCLLAISTLYEHPQYVISFRSKAERRQGAFDLVKRGRSPTHREDHVSVDTHHRKALKFYNRAIRGFKQRMNDGSASLALALASCILFVCVETIRDHVHSAMTLYERGIEMLNQCSESMNSTSELALVALVRRMFLRLGVLAAIFGQPSGALMKLDSSPLVCSSSFKTIAEARLELFSILAESNAFTLASNVWRDALFDARQWRDDGSHYSRFAERRSELDLLFTDLKRRHGQHSDMLIRWREAFEPLRNLCASTESGSISYLMMMYCTFAIWMPTRLSHRKMAFDAHASKFRELVHHAEVFVNHNVTDRPVFTFDIGAIPSLYYAASECRVPSIRRKALALLQKAPKKESIMGADSSAEIAHCLISIEERGLGLPDPAEFDESSSMAEIDDSKLPEEEKRVHFMEAGKNGDVFEVRVTMLVEEDGFFHWHVEDVPV